LLRAGIEVRRLPVSERFSLAVTDPEDVEEDSPVQAFTPANPFRFSEKQAGILGSAFVQDRVRFGEHWTVDLGLRLDHPDLIVHETELSPRIGLAYHIVRTNTTVHASYNRLVQMPALENILLSFSSQAEVLEAESDPGAREREPKMEKQNHYQFGFQQRLGKHLQFDAVHYVKNINNFMDDEQLFETAIVFPVELARADIRGSEVRVDFDPLPGWTGYISYANARATVTAPLVGGLFLEPEGEFADAGKQFPADSDERNEVQFGMTYTHKSGLWGTFNTRYDSGIPSEFEDADFATFDPKIQRQLDPLRHRIKPRTIVNVAGGVELFRESSHPASLQVGVNNLFDRFYLYNFRSIFSGTHIARPREAVVRLTFRWKAR
jgi:outer membrane receptor protein involved in Fe transport